MLSRSVLGRMSQSLVVLVTIAAWFSLSHHCVLGLGVASSQLAEPADSFECPMHSTPTQEKEPAAKLPCCKDLRATAAKSAAGAKAATIRLVRSQDHAQGVFLPPPRLTIEIAGLDTGPPGAFSFAEAVLQQSLLAHAPPLS